MQGKTPAGPEAIEAQVQEDLARLDAYRNQLNQMLQQHSVLSASRLDHLRARDALEGLDRGGEDREILVPLGGEAYIRGRLDRTGPVQLGLGAGHFAEVERPKAAEILAERTKAIEDAAMGLEGQMRALEERITAISRRVEALTSPAEGSGPSEDVGGD
jgi:prefoldin alpha subunit